MPAPLQDPDVPSQKLSRYRSTRQKPTANQTATRPSYPPPTSYAEPTPVSSVQRSRSRYRRANPFGNGDAPPLDATQNAIAQQARLAEEQSRTNGIPNSGAQPDHGAYVVPTPPFDAGSPRLNGSSPTQKQHSREALRGGRAANSEERAKLEARRVMEKEAERQQKLRDRIAQQRESDRQRRQTREDAKTRQLEEESGLQRQREENEKRKVDESLRRQGEEVTRNRYQRKNDESPVTQLGKQQSRDREEMPHADHHLKPSGSKELFGMFKRKRGEANATSHATGEHKLSKTPAYQAPFHDAPVPPAPPVANHGMDAPVSAVNAGERQVLVQANGSSAYLPITPTTTSSDLIRSAANTLSGSIDPRASVLMESFGKVGVQRPLRKYEHVRDVMNSWDDDRQHSLMLVPSAAGGNDAELEASHVPKDQPEEFACQLSYSQKPGKWDKRWVTLRQDGQVTVAKKPAMKQADQTNVCHISDFDIYTPAPKQLARKIRPPKKHCFAIKSQQKSNLFMSMESFVHFFCSGDKKTAALFYRAVQGWRSWYLVNVLGEGQRSPKKPAVAERTSAGAGAGANGLTVPNETAAPHMRESSKDSQYQIGSFKPLIDLDVFNNNNNNNSSSANPPDTTLTRQRTRSNSTSQGQGISLKPTRTSGGGAAPPSSFPNRYHAPGTNTSTDHGRKTSGSNPTSPSDDAAFAPSGLLGRTYSKRQAEAQARDSQRNANAFTQGPSLLNDTLSPPPRASIDQDRPSPTTSPVGLTPTTAMNIKRSSSQRKPRPLVEQKPLVDLTPQYREPPQHAKKGKGFYPEQLGTGGLVESATSPEEAIFVPSSTDWRAGRQDTVKGRPGTAQRPGTNSGRGSGGGLPSAWNPGGVNGSADRTMSLAQRTKSIKRSEPPAEAGFHTGSLLDKVQKEGREHFDEGRSGMRWDRSKGEEVTVAYGEGV